jgi:hypothetical protein
VLAGSQPAITEPFVLADHLNDRQHKCHQCWRLLKQPASTNVMFAGGRLSEPLAQGHLCWRLLRPPATESIFTISYIIPHNYLLFLYNLSFLFIIFSHWHLYAKFTVI